MMVDLIRMQECWQAPKTIKVLIYVEFVRAFRPNLKAVNKIELLKKYERQRYDLGINRIGLFQST